MTKAKTLQQVPFKYEVIYLKQHCTEWLISKSWSLFCDVGAYGFVLSIP